MANPPSPANLPLARTPVDIEDWTRGATQALRRLSIGQSRSPGLRGTSVAIDIPLHHHSLPRTPGPTETDSEQPTRPATPRRREPLRRDSLKRREALLRGNEGSRRRQRWENGRLLGNPHAEPPLPCDWEVRPTHPQYAVPYFLASRWDDAMARQHNERAGRAKSAPAVTEAAPGVTVNVPKEVREKLKRARAAKGLLQHLEEQVRGFVTGWDQRQKQKGTAAGPMPVPDSDPDELLFPAGDGQMHDRPDTTHVSHELASEKLVFDSLEADQGATFARWLVHSLGLYYGLETWSVTTGNPARREAYVGIKESKSKSGRSTPPKAMPRPLSGLV